MNEAPPLARHARGRRPTAFADPAHDTLVAMLLKLAEEHWATRARLMALEHWAAHEVAAQRTPWSDDYALPDAAAEELDRERERYLKAIMEPVERL